MKRLLAAISLLAVLLAALAYTLAPREGTVRLLVFADRTLQPPLEEVARLYVEERGRDGVRVNITFIYGSSGYVLSQLEIHGGGDLYVADDRHFATIGIEKGLLDPGTYREIGYIRLALLVAEGNPSGIESLVDALNRSDVRLAIGNPEHVSAGVLAKRVLEENGLWGLVEEQKGTGKIVFTNSAAEAASYVMLGLVDAAVTFHTYEVLNPGKLDSVPDPILDRVQAPVVVAVPVASSPHSMDFYNFLLGHIDIFYKYGIEPGGSR